jgi:predicted esterase
MVPKICKPGAALAAVVGLAILLQASGCKRLPREGDAAVMGRGRWGGLDTRTATSPSAPAKGGRVLVLLHGFGGRPDAGSFSRAARVAAVRQGLRIFMPAGPEAYRGGRAWWGGDGRYWPAHAGGDEQGEVLGTDPPLATARRAVQALLKDVQAQFEPEALMIAGYSQGGMLAMDVALARDPPVDRVVILSSTMLASSLPGLRAEGVARPPVFVVHGRSDTTVPFASGQRLLQLLQGRGHPVIWRTFDGGHQLPPRDVFDEIVLFLGGAMPPATR